MFKWIAHEKERFLMTYTDIGSTFHQSHELQCQHTEFAEACEVSITLSCNVRDALKWSLLIETKIFTLKR